MTWQSLLDEKVQKFIRDHENDDVANLALKKPPVGVEDYPMVLDQIKARQKAAVKVPDWLDLNDVVFPPSSVMEQASSAACALYKAGLVAGESFVDLTGGVGVDSWGFSKYFRRGVAVERDETVAAPLS